MSEVIQIIPVNQQDKYFERDLINGDWHGTITFGLGPRTICGIQLDGDDGYNAGEPRHDGEVTCSTCLGIINSIVSRYGKVTTRKG